MKQENYKYILNQFSNNVITFLGTKFNMLSKSQIGRPDTQLTITIYLKTYITINTVSSY
jgi:hypothetical protein